MEQWRDIPGIPGYQASNLGSIRHAGRTVRARGGYRSVKPRTLVCFVAKGTGYRQVDIRKVAYLAHRLVALAWCDGHFDGAVVDHINNDRSDNRASNLEWVTYSENTRRSFERGRRNPFAGAFSADHPTSKAVIATNIKTGKERLYASAMDAVREGFESSCISKCCAGKSRYHKGHYWRFASPTETSRGGFLELQERTAA